MSKSKISQALLKLSETAMPWKDQEKLEKLSEIFDEIKLSDVEFLIDYKHNDYFTEEDMQEKNEEIEELERQVDNLNDDIESLQEELKEQESKL